MHRWDPSFLDTNAWRNSSLLWEFSMSVISKEWGNCLISKHPGEMVLESFSYFLLHHLQWLVLPSLMSMELYSELLHLPAVPPSSLFHLQLLRFHNIPLTSLTLLTKTASFSTSSDFDLNETLKMISSVHAHLTLLRILLSHKSAFNTRLL